MDLAGEYERARADERLARLRRIVVLRAMVSTGMSQRAVAAELEVSQPAVNQQLKAATGFDAVPAETLLEAAAPILKQLAAEKGFTELAVFGSVARHRARRDSDFDLIVRQPPGTTIGGLTEIRRLFEAILGRPVDLVTYGALKPVLDDDIRRDAVLL